MLTPAPYCTWSLTQEAIEGRWHKVHESDWFQDSSIIGHRTSTDMYYKGITWPLRGCSYSDALIDVKQVSLGRAMCCLPQVSEHSHNTIETLTSHLNTQCILVRVYLLKKRMPSKAHGRFRTYHTRIFSDHVEHFSGYRKLIHILALALPNKRTTVNIAFDE